MRFWAVLPVQVAVNGPTPCQYGTVMYDDVYTLVPQHQDHSTARCPYV